MIVPLFVQMISHEVQLILENNVVVNGDEWKVTEKEELK
jgi:hypothetical protein